MAVKKVWSPKGKQASKRQGRDGQKSDKEPHFFIDNTSRILVSAPESHRLLIPDTEARSFLSHRHSRAMKIIRPRLRLRSCFSLIPA